MCFTQSYLTELSVILSALDPEPIEAMARALQSVRRQGGRLFVLGVGGSAANASHAVNDFRKIAGIEAYAPTDNVAELTARTNDDGWVSTFAEWLKVSHLRQKDALLVLSVGGGTEEVSENIFAAVHEATYVGATVLGVVGPEGGETAEVADVCLLVPGFYPAHVTPHAETVQAVVWHLLVSHPLLTNC
jgi:D-sedoheptulose 7-phosphate isomerase